LAEGDKINVKPGVDPEIRMLEAPRGRSLLDRLTNRDVVQRLKDKVAYLIIDVETRDRQMLMKDNLIKSQGELIDKMSGVMESIGGEVSQLTSRIEALEDR
jgi:hypothetical protein